MEPGRIGLEPASDTQVFPGLDGPAESRPGVSRKKAQRVTVEIDRSGRTKKAPSEPLQRIRSVEAPGLVAECAQRVRHVIGHVSPPYFFLSG
jgi:hypothetical protein